VVPDFITTFKIICLEKSTFSFCEIKFYIMTEQASLVVMSYTCNRKVVSSKFCEILPALNELSRDFLRSLQENSRTMPQ
jgi:hypothetical protein